MGITIGEIKSIIEAAQRLEREKLSTPIATALTKELVTSELVQKLKEANQLLRDVYEECPDVEQASDDPWVRIDAYLRNQDLE